MVLEEETSVVTVVGAAVVGGAVVGARGVVSGGSRLEPCLVVPHDASAAQASATARHRGVRLVTPLANVALPSQRVSTTERSRMEVQ